MRKALLIATAVILLMPVVATAQNIPPVVDAGEDQTVYLGNTVYLNATASDANGDSIVGWIWEIVSSPAGSTPMLGGEFSASARFDAVTAGDYVLSVKAYDGTDWSLPDTITISYVLNEPPVAVALATPVTGIAPLTVQFDGTQSYDPEDGELIYLWDFGDINMTPPTLEPSPVHTYETPGTFFAELVVQDDSGQVVFDTVEITVEEPPPGWGGASVVGMRSASPSTGLNYFIGLLVPLGVVILLKRLRRR